MGEKVRCPHTFGHLIYIRLNTNSLTLKLGLPIFSAICYAVEAVVTQKLRLWVTDQMVRRLKPQQSLIRHLTHCAPGLCTIADSALYVYISVRLILCEEKNFTVL